MEDLARTPELVESDERLSRLCRRWLGHEWVALDTEFIRVDTFYPRAGLVQVCDGEGAYLVDVPACGDLSPLCELITAPAVTKILHSCLEDLLVFQSLLGAMPAPVFDTQIAAAFLNRGLSLGYQGLVKEETGIELPKTETRSDWLHRPLSVEQVHYAALDVIYLPEIYRRQYAALKQRGLLAWMEEDCRACLRQYDGEISGDFSAYFKEIKGAWKLKPRELALLRRLVEWRERRARKRDKPRNWIIRDQQLLQIAARAPGNKQELAAMEGVGANFVKYEGGEIIKLIHEAGAMDAGADPAPLPGPLAGSQKKQLKAMQRVVARIAERLEIPAEVLARKRQLLELFHSVLDARERYPDRAITPELVAIPPSLRGWRETQLLPELLEVLAD